MKIAIEISTTKKDITTLIYNKMILNNDFYAKTISNCPIHILKKTMQFNKEYVLLLRNVDK